MARRPKSLDADDQIDAMTIKLASLDRRLANLQRLRPRGSATVEELRAQRDQCRRDLQDLVELAELPIELMGWA
jgi:hypothetical protein